MIKTVAYYLEWLMLRSYGDVWDWLLLFYTVWLRQRTYSFFTDPGSQSFELFRILTLFQVIYTETKTTYGCSNMTTTGSGSSLWLFP